MTTEYIANDENLPRDWFEIIVEKILNTILDPQKRLGHCAPIKQLSELTETMIEVWGRSVYRLNLTEQEDQRYKNLTDEGKIAIGLRVTGLFRLLKSCFDVITVNYKEGFLEIIDYTNINPLRKKEKNCFIAYCPNDEDYHFNFLNMYSREETSIQLKSDNSDDVELLELLGDAIMHKNTQYFNVQKNFVEDIFMFRGFDTVNDYFIDKIALINEFAPRIERNNPIFFISASLTWFKMFVPFYEKYTDWLYN